VVRIFKSHSVIREWRGLKREREQANCFVSSASKQQDHRGVHNCKIRLFLNTFTSQ